MKEIFHLKKFQKNSSDVDKLVKTAKESGLDDILIGIGYGKINAQDIVEKVYPQTPMQIKKVMKPF